MRPAHIFLAVFIVVLWGANFVAIRESVTQAPPIFVTAIRFLIQAILLLPFVGFCWKKIKLLMPYTMVMGIGHFGLIFLGISGLDASVAAIVMQLNTPLLVLFAWWLLGDQFGWRRTLGMIVAFTGIFILAGKFHTVSEWQSVVILMLSSACWAFGNIQIKRLDFISPFQIMAWISLMSLPGLFLLSALIETGQFSVIFYVDQYFWLSIAYMSIGSTICGYGLWYYLLARYDISVVAYYNMLVPLVAVGLGVIILGEPLTLERIVGGSLTILGVGFIQFRTIIANNSIRKIR